MPSQKTIMHPIRALVIGAGAMADFMHLPILARLRDRGEIELAVVCDVERDRAAAARRKFGFKEDISDAIAGLKRQDVDAVYIFASAQMHYEYGMRALECGKHLFVEKPVSPSFAQARALAQAARAQGLVAVGGHNRRFYASLAAARAHAGRAGWRYAEAILHKPMFGQKPQFGARTWLGANGIHALDALFFMMGGLPEHVSALTDSGEAETASAFSAVMRWRDGGQGVFLCNNNAGARREEYVFHAPGETCTATETELILEKSGKASRTAFPSTNDSFAAEHESFVKAIRSGEEPAHSIAAVAPSLFLGELIECGFSGPVSLPVMEPERAALAAPRLLEKSILVVQTAALQPALAKLLPHYRLVSLDDVREPGGERPDIVAAILGKGSLALAPEILAKLPRLAIVGVAGLSVARYEPDALLYRGITLINASNAYAQSVAEFALGLAILGRRRAFASHENMREGRWGVDPQISGIDGRMRQAAKRLHPFMQAAGLEEPFLRTKRIFKRLAAKSGTPQITAALSRELHGATVGLVGWGANARAFAEHLGNHGARIIVYSEHATNDEIRSAGASPASLGDVLAADIVSLHRGLTPDTRHFLGATELARLRPGSVLINVARGGLIDEGALVARLQQGDIFACLDTFESEPLSRSHPLRRLPNVFLTSHIAGGSPDMNAAAAEEIVQKVAAYLAGRSVEAISSARLRNMT